MIAYHTTSEAAVDMILKDGLRINRDSNFTQSGSWADEVYGVRPIYLSLTPDRYAGEMILKVNLDGIDYVADLPSLVDTGAYVTENGIYWEEDEPEPFTYLLNDGEFYFGELLAPGNVVVDAAVETTGTLAVLNDIPADRISVFRTKKFALISNPVIWLRDYLTMSDADKGRELAYEFDNLFMDWFLKHGLEFISQDEFDNMQNEDVYDLVPNLPDELFEKFLESKSYDVMSYPDAPSFLFMEFRDIVRNQWLIHFTDNAYSIAVDGFTKGAPDIQNLAITTQLPKVVKEAGGYDFAYDVNDFARYGRSSRGWKYGNEAVLFRASGIKVWHYGDEEYQVIFWGATANSFVAIFENGSMWGVGARSDNGEPIFESDDLEEVVDWVINNYDQYKRVL